MSGSRLEQLYADAMARRGRPGGACVSPEDLLALVRREGSEERRLEVLDHVMSCEACHREFELLRAVDSAGASSAGAVPIRGSWRRLAPLALAASLLLAVGLGVMARNRHQAGDAIRSGGHGLVLLAPATTVAPAESINFVWRPVAGAERYRLEIMDQSGSVVFTQLTPDTALAVPGNRLEAGSAYRWWVRDATPGAQLASDLRPLRVRTK